jgi:hypothetical protein
MEYHPYRRLAAALPDWRDEYPPAVPYLAEHGYAVVQHDVTCADRRSAMVQRRGRLDRGKSYQGDRAVARWPCSDRRR